VKVVAARSTDSFGNHLQHSGVPEPIKLLYGSSPPIQPQILIQNYFCRALRKPASRPDGAGHARCGCCGGAVDVFILLGCYAASVGTLYRRFWKTYRSRLQGSGSS
jgi:hypothetical protein